MTLVTINHGDTPGIRKEEMPLSVLANTKIISASPGIVMSVLVPFKIYTFPERTAFVWIDFAYEPQQGSVSAKDAKLLPSTSPFSLRNSFFCRSSPNSLIPSQIITWIDTCNAVFAQAFANISIAAIYTG